MEREGGGSLLQNPASQMGLKRERGPNRAFRVIISEKCLGTCNFFWVPKALVKISISCIVLNFAEITHRL